MEHMALCTKKISGISSVIITMRTWRALCSCARDSCFLSYFSNLSFKSLFLFYLFDSDWDFLLSLNIRLGITIIDPTLDRRIHCFHTQISLLLFIVYVWFNLTILRCLYINYNYNITISTERIIWYLYMMTRPGSYLLIFFLLIKLLHEYGFV